MPKLTRIMQHTVLRQQHLETGSDIDRLTRDIHNGDLSTLRAILARLRVIEAECWVKGLQAQAVHSGHSHKLLGPEYSRASFLGAVFEARKALDQRRKELSGLRAGS